MQVQVKRKHVSVETSGSEKWLRYVIIAEMSTRKNNSATARLKQDYLRLKKDPVPYITAEPLPNNILEWHYVVSFSDACIIYTV